MNDYGLTIFMGLLYNYENNGIDYLPIPALLNYNEIINYKTKDIEKRDYSFVTSDDIFSYFTYFYDNENKIGYYKLIDDSEKIYDMFSKIRKSYDENIIDICFDEEIVNNLCLDAGLVTNEKVMIKK